MGRLFGLIFLPCKWPRRFSGRVRAERRRSANLSLLPNYLTLTSSPNSGAPRTCRCGPTIEPISDGHSRGKVLMWRRSWSRQSVGNTLLCSPDTLGGQDTLCSPLACPPWTYRATRFSSRCRVLNGSPGEIVSNGRRIIRPCGWKRSETGLRLVWQTSGLALPTRDFPPRANHHGRERHWIRGRIRDGASRCSVIGFDAAQFCRPEPEVGTAAVAGGCIPRSGRPAGKRRWRSRLRRPDQCAGESESRNVFRA